MRYVVGLLGRWRPAWTVEVRVTDFKGRSRMVEEGLVVPLRRAAPAADVRPAPERAHGRGYYTDISYQVLVVTETGTRFEIADGGSVDWATKLLSDRRERLVIGGMGIERLLN